MPDFFGVYDDMKVIEYLEFFAAAYRIKGAARRKVCDEMLELVDLGYKRDALVTSLSRGMTQRLGLARVLLHDPQGAAAGRAGQRSGPPGADRDPRAAESSSASWARRSWSPATSCPSWPTSATRSASSSRASCWFNANVADVMKQVRQQTAAEHRRGRRSGAGRPAAGTERAGREGRHPRRPDHGHAGRERRPTTATCPRC